MLIADDLDKLLEIFPDFIRLSLKNHHNRKELLEIVMDLGRRPEARFPGNPQYLSNKAISWQDLDYCVKRIGIFSGDNRSGIERTLHRISSIRNRQGNIIGLTCRVGRALFGTIGIIRDLLEKQKSILILGKPGVGKTTAIREIARILADEMEKRVIVIDTSNEIAGDGDIPHPALGRARRMQVARPELQHQVMIEAVENHMPQVIIIDEISTELEALAARTIAERGVQLVGTVHGNFLNSLIKNPTLCDLVGGIQYVTLGDDEAKRRGTQKSILERKATSAFQVAVEVHERHNWTIHEKVDLMIDHILQGSQSFIQHRKILPSGKLIINIQGSLSRSNIWNDYSPNLNKQKLNQRNFTSQVKKRNSESESLLAVKSTFNRKSNKLQVINSFSDTVVNNAFLYIYLIDSTPIQNVIIALKASLVIVKDINKADIILALRSHVKQDTKLRQIAKSRQITIYTIHSSTIPQITRALRRILNLSVERAINWQTLFKDKTSVEIEALEETRFAIEKIIVLKKQSVELLPQVAIIRKIQHKLVNIYNFRGRSFGEEPHRCLRIYLI